AIAAGTPGPLRLGQVTINGSRLTVGGSTRSLELTGLTLAAAAGATVDVAVPVTINGPIAQSAAGAGLTKSGGTETLRLGGATANTYAGLTRVNAGTLELAKPNNVLAVPGNLSVFGGTVRLLADGQVADGAAVSVNHAGT